MLASSGFVTDTDAEYFEGALAYYDPSGYVLEVSLEDRTKFRSIIAALKECQWIDLATRIIYVEVNFFNPTMNTYLVGHLRFEIDKKFREHNVSIPFPQRDVHLFGEKK